MSKRLRVTISFDIPNADMYTNEDEDTLADGYRWLWDNDKSAALDPLYEDDPVLVEVKEL
jgi:hypothetical protein